jgi:ATP-dependent DNA ligase
MQAAISSEQGPCRRASRRPLRDRRARLEDVVAGSELVFAVRRLASDGLDAWEQVMQRGYEGLVGGPTWLKVKRRAGPSRRTVGSGGSA